MEDKYTNRKCPICNSGNSKIEVYSDPKAEDSDYSLLKNTWNGFFKKKVIFSYHRCSECGTLYTPKFFSDTQLKSLYSQMPANMSEVPISALKKTQRGYFNYFKKYSDLNGNFLEIGPDVGYFTENCISNGQYQKYWLIEPNFAVHEELKRLTSNKDSTITIDMNDLSHIPNESIDTVVFIHVMDHLLEPSLYIDELKKKLKKNSKILIVTHNERSILRKLFKLNWPPFCLQHPQLFNLNTTKDFLDKNNFEILGQHQTRNYFKLSYLVKHFLWAIGFKIKNVPNLFGLVLGLKLGNIITIAKYKG